MAGLQNQLQMYPLAGGALGGVGYCMAMGRPVDSAMGMGMCALVGAASGAAINFANQQYLKLPMLADDTSGSMTTQLMYGALYGFVGAAVVGMAM